MQMLMSLNKFSLQVRMHQAVVGILGEHLGRRGVNPALEIHKHVIHVEIKYRLFHNRRIKIIT